MLNWLKRIFSREKPETIPTTTNELIQRAQQTSNCAAEIRWVLRPRYHWFKKVTFNDSGFGILALVISGILAFIWTFGCIKGSNQTPQWAWWIAAIWPTLYIGIPSGIWARKMRNWLKEEQQRIAKINEKFFSQLPTNTNAVAKYFETHIQKMRDRVMGNESPIGTLRNRLDDMEKKYTFMLGYFGGLIAQNEATDVDRAEHERIQDSLKRVRTCIESVERQKTTIMQMFGTITAHLPIIQQQLQRHLLIKERVALDLELGHVEADVHTLMQDTQHAIDKELSRISQALNNATTHALGLPTPDLSHGDIAGAMKNLVAHEGKLAECSTQLEQDLSNPSTEYA